MGLSIIVTYRLSVTAGSNSELIAFLFVMVFFFFFVSSVLILFLTSFYVSVITMN